jgi:hypothetical protein
MGEARDGGEARDRRTVFPLLLWWHELERFLGGIEVTFMYTPSQISKITGMISGLRDVCF